MDPFRACLPNYLIRSLQPCGHLLGRADLLVLLYVMFSCDLSFSHMKPLVRYG